MLHPPLKPMLAKLSPELPEGDGWRARFRRDSRGAGNVYITYFSGTSPLTQTAASSGNIFLSTSRDNGLTWGTPAKVVQPSRRKKKQ